MSVIADAHPDLVHRSTRRLLLGLDVEAERLASAAARLLVALARRQHDGLVLHHRTARVLDQVFHGELLPAEEVVVQLDRDATVLRLSRWTLVIADLRRYWHRLNERAPASFRLLSVLGPLHFFRLRLSIVAGRSLRTGGAPSGQEGEEYDAQISCGHCVLLHSESTPLILAVSIVATSVARWGSHLRTHQFVFLMVLVWDSLV